MQDKLEVLIIEDSEIVSERIRMWLDESRHIHVMGEAISSRRAMHLLDHNHPDVVLLDISIMNTEASALLAYLKQIAIKVIILSNYTEPYYRRLCMGAGADYFFDKSTEFEKIPGVLADIFSSKIITDSPSEILSY